MTISKYTEAELYQPIKDYFVHLGYDVDGEVIDCDMLLVKDQDYIAIELKTDLNFKLFLQGAKRQKMFENVFVAVWAPKNLRSKAFRDKLYLLNRLGIGLIMVSIRTKQVTVLCEPTIHPVEVYQKRNKKLKDRVIAEFSKRRTKSNTGGVTGTKLLTAYKEDCFIILDTLVNQGNMKASIIKAETGISTSYNKVYHNHYGWFLKEGKGIYGVSPCGLDAYEANKDLILKLRIVNKEVK